MAEAKEFTFSDVSEHTSKRDLYLIVHDKVYNSSSFVDEHPYVTSSPTTPGQPTIIFERTSTRQNWGYIITTTTQPKRTRQLTYVCYSGGEEVLLDVGGQDATEAFEDVGHSDEAREILDGMLVGTLKRQVRPFSSPFHSPPPKHQRRTIALI